MSRANIAFASLDPFLDRNIVLPTEKASKKENWIEWGDGNKYPEYLLDLYNNVPTLRSIINGNIDFICGDDSSIVPFGVMRDNEVNHTGETLAEQLRDIARDYEIYGGFALQVIRDYDGGISEIYHTDMRYLRANKECDVFYYCEDWSKGGKKDVLIYPAFMPNLNWAMLNEEGRKAHANSILYVKNVRTQVYPSPVYSASVKACEIERNIDNYHLNSISNGFASSAIINFNNGRPEDAICEQIENEFTEKFSGAENAGRIMFSWNNSKESATDIVVPQVQDFGDKYNALSDHSRQQIFTAFRATPALFGIVEKTGFNEQEYESAFKLYNRTQVRPVQRRICDAYDKILGMSGTVTINPFTLEGLNTVK